MPRRVASSLNLLLRGSLRLALILVVAEILLRAHAWWVGEPQLCQFDAALGWRTRPELTRMFQSAEGPYLIETNSRGYRDDEDAGEQDDANFRVAALGASTIFGFGVDQTELLTEVIEDLLPGVDVMNFACTAYSIDQQYLQLRNEVLGYRPDVVVQFVLPSDAVDPFRSWELASHRPKPCLLFREGKISFAPPGAQLIHRLVSSSYVLEKGQVFILGLAIADQLLNIRALERSTWRQTLSRDEQLQALRLLLRETRDLCHARGAEHLVIFMPAVVEFPEFLPNEENRLMTDLRASLQANELRVLEVSDILDAAKHDPAQPPVYHMLHLTSRGHRLIAEQIAGQLATSLAAKSRNPLAPTKSSSGFDK